MSKKSHKKLNVKKKRIIIQGVHAKAHDKAKGRLAFVTFFLLMGYFIICFRLVDLTFFRKSGEIKTRDVKIENRIKSFKKYRADIIDRNGAIIATSLEMASAYADPRLIDNPKELAKKVLKIIPEVNYKKLVKLFSENRHFIWIKRNITPKQKYELNVLGEPAIGFKNENKRIYPNGNLTAHITGYTDIDGNGIAGIEKYFDKELKTSDKPIQLSVDLRVQHIMRSELEKALKKFTAKAAIGMVMDVNSGEVISMVSLPDFDPNNIKHAKNNELFNRATLGVYEMGSTFKLFSVSAALDEGKVSFATMFDVRKSIKMNGYTISDFHSKHRPLSVPEVFIYSSNVGAAKMAELLGNDGMQGFFRSMGFMDKALLEIPELGRPIYPSPWRDINTLTTSFGHGIAVSPLHLIRAASGLVNGGIMPRSTLIKVKDDGKDFDYDIEKNRVIKEETSEKIRKLLELVVAGGTGKKAYVAGYNVGGKTGTAEKNINGKYEKNVLFSSFLGVFPIDNPRYAVLAILDEPHGIKSTHNYATGGWTAAPVVSKVIEHMGALYQIPPDKKNTPKQLEKEMSKYLKDFKEGKHLAAIEIDH